jgi:signal transduction histidine kinase
MMEQRQDLPIRTLGDNKIVRHLRNLAVFEIAFYFAYRYGMSVFSDSPSPLWFPDSVLLCALLLTPRSVWWMYIVAPIPIRLLVAVPTGMPAWFLPAVFINDSLKALLSAFLLRRGNDVGAWFSGLRGFARYLLIAVGLSPALSAVGGAVSLRSEFWPTWVQWFLGDALASIVLTPLLFCLVRVVPAFRPPTLLRLLEGLCVAAGLVSAAYVAFVLDWRGLNSLNVLLYLPSPFLIWAAVRFGPLGASAASFAVSMMVTFGATFGRGPFAATASDSVVLSVQLFLLVPSIAILFLAVLGEQQRQTHSALRESELRFRSLVDSAPVMVGVDISHHKQAEERLTTLPYEVKSAQEAERRRIGQELHDDLGQRVVALSLGISFLSQQIGGDETISARFENLRQEASDIVKEIARISHRLRPSVLENLGLSTALQNLCEKSRDPNRMNIVFAQHGDLPQHLPWLSSIALYRVAQEALRNALTHSGSDLINIELRATPTSLAMAVTDKGCGFDVEHSRRGLGLSGMAERMNEISGNLRIDSTPGSGTTVTATVPIGPQAKAAGSASA